jgi:hypothetical protein
MYCPLKVVAWTIIDSVAIQNPVPAYRAAANDNEDERFEALAQDVVAILLRDGLKLLAG